MAENIRQRILLAARICFARQGYAGTSINQICREAHVALATLYRYFNGKRALYIAVGSPQVDLAIENPQRQEILEAALNQFSRYGYHGTTMTAIAALAGVARATLYAQFPTKESLLEELLQGNQLVDLAKRLPEHSGIMSGNASEPDIERLALLFLREFQDERRVALLRLILADGMRFPPLRRAYHHMIATSVDIFSQYLAEADPQLENPRFSARMFVGSLLGFIISQQIIPGTLLPILSSEEIAREVVRQFMTGISLREETKQTEGREFSSADPGTFVR
ncbi:MAG: TetR/AcrR family transcriptional regulator [Omnitrophica WOR_2 bacterium]